MRPVVIVVEGGEGSGKTTALAGIKEYLETCGLSVMPTREPGGVKIAEEIREIILHVDHVQMTKETEALLYAAARNQHLNEKVLPALADGKSILFDRFVMSSYVYQGIARGIDMTSLKAINQFATCGFIPDITLLLDVSPSVGFERVRSGRIDGVNRLDLEGMDFHVKVRNGHLAVAKDDPTVKVINANKDQATVLQSCIKEIDAFMRQRELYEAN